MQYWLLKYGNTCPTAPYTGWISSKGSCFRNSPAIPVAQLPITQLSTLKVAGWADNLHDGVVMFVGAKAYRAVSKDNVVFVASGWAGSEFNVFGDAGGSQADFNKGTSITVRLLQRDGTRTAPTCKGNSGTTGEITNLTLGACKTGVSTRPYITFSEAD